MSREGASISDSELIGVLDADFILPPDFLRRTVPYMVADPSLGIVQTRWGHLNAFDNWLTRAQAHGDRRDEEHENPWMPLKEIPQVRLPDIKEVADVKGEESDEQQKDDDKDIRYRGTEVADQFPL